MQQNGRLFLIPSDLGSESVADVWPGGHSLTIAHLRHFIVENVRSARRFLRKSGFEAAFEDVEFYVLDQHTGEADKARFLDPATHGQDMGLLSEAGVPCVADPGQEIVSMAHKRGIRVIPLVGASSVILGLMASGFNGQQFVFHGYLPIARDLRAQKILEMEKAASQLDQTQIFIETPYRNKQLLADLTAICRPETMLCVACDLTLDTEYIRTQSVRLWKKEMPGLHKRPGIFLLYHA